jgi:hypothetical protein
MKDFQIQILELRRLLHELKDQQANTCIRFRLVGEMWQQNFLKILKVTEFGVVLMDERSHQKITIVDLRQVVQFEIDARYQSFHPHNHYAIETTVNISERHANSGR